MSTFDQVEQIIDLTKQNYRALGEKLQPWDLTIIRKDAGLLTTVQAQARIQVLATALSQVAS